MATFPPKRIAVAMDFSPPAHSALNLAKPLAKRWKAHLDLIYVQSPIKRIAGVDLQGAPVYVPATSHEVVAIKDLRQHELRKASVGFSPKFLTTHTAVGWPAEEIARMARTRICDLLVMGTHGYSGLDRLLAPSIAEEVIRKTQVPVLTVHPHHAAKAIERILVPWNMTPYADDTLLYAFDLASSLNAGLDILYVSQSGAQWKEYSRRLVDGHLAKVLGKDKGATVGVEIGDGDPRTTILNFSSKKKYDLVVISAHRRKFLSDFVLGSTAQRLVRHSETPVLSVPSIETRHQRKRREIGIPRWATDKLF